MNRKQFATLQRIVGLVHERDRQRLARQAGRIQALARSAEDLNRQALELSGEAMERPVEEIALAVEYLNWCDHRQVKIAEEIARERKTIERLRTEAAKSFGKVLALEEIGRRSLKPPKRY